MAWGYGPIERYIADRGFAVDMKWSVSFTRVQIVKAYGNQNCSSYIDVDWIGPYAWGPVAKRLDDAMDYMDAVALTVWAKTNKVDVKKSIENIGFVANANI